MEPLEETKWTGRFTISPGKDLYGELNFKGPETSLYLDDKASFNPLDIPDECITGVLHDLTKVSLMQCVTLSGPGSGPRGNDRYHFANIFPHYVVYGDRHIGPSEKVIAEVRFVVDDASTLFYDFDAFSSLLDARPFIEQITRANGLNREVVIGPNPAIQYFTGKNEIFAADTVLGKISASHSPRLSSGGPSGVYLKNTIYVKLAFKEARAFDDAVLHTLALLRYLGTLVGRPQNVLELMLRVKSDEQNATFLKVYWSMPPKRGPSHEGRKPSPAEVLLDAVGRPEEFSRVLASWLDRQPSWRIARLSFFNSFAKQQRYDSIRLIASADMFDILPKEALPPDVTPSEQLKAAKATCEEIFNRLPRSPERDSVLSALGRVGKSSLRHKIRHRAQLVIDAIGDRLPELVLVIDEAVKCRNYYVHGGKPSFSYDDNFNAVVFFTNTLEFVFAASDLIESGWDIQAWSKIGTTGAHPFADYRADYTLCLQKLKALFPVKSVG
jgi:hypothetical protein